MYQTYICAIHHHMMKCEHNIHIIVKHVEIRFKHAFEPDVKYNLRSLNYSIHHMSYVNP